MNKLFVFIIVFIFLNNCSLNENSRIWKAKNKDLTQNENIKKLFVEEKIKSTEFNPELAINITKVNSDSKEANNRNDNGSQNYIGLLKKDISFTFSKLDNINHLDYKPVFLPDGIIFFDKKGTIIRYNNEKK